MPDNRRFLLTRRRFVASLMGFSAAVPLLRAPSLAHAANILAAPAAVPAAQTSKVFVDARTTEAAGVGAHTPTAPGEFPLTPPLVQGPGLADQKPINPTLPRPQLGNSK